MQFKEQKYLLDIQISINSIFSYLGKERNFNRYKAEKLLRRAVERELEIIGEALNYLLKINPTVNITDARKIVDLRNWVIHSYDKVDDVIIWGVITNYLPKLRTEVEALIIP